MIRLLNIHDLTRERFIDATGSYSYWNMFIVYRGSFMLGEDEQVAQAGDVVIFPPDEPFCRRVIEPVSFLSVHFAWEQGVQAHPAGVLHFQDADRIVSTALLLKRLVDQPHRTTVGSHLLTDIWYQHLLESQDASHRMSAANAYVAAAMEMMERNMAKEIRMAEIADRLHISQVHLIQLFKRYVGMPPSEYLMNKRMQKAKSLLIDTSLGMQQIAQACGFSNGYYFSTSFRKAEGMPPSRFRQLYRV